MMNNVKAYSRGGCAHIQNSHSTLELAMSHLIEQVTDSDHTDSFSCKVYCRAGRARAENAGDQLQVSAFVAQVVSCCGENWLY
jgi:hypothetical protein